MPTGLVPLISRSCLSLHPYTPFPLVGCANRGGGGGRDGEGVLGGGRGVHAQLICWSLLPDVRHCSDFTGNGPDCLFPDGGDTCLGGNSRTLAPAASAPMASTPLPAPTAFCEDVEGALTTNDVGNVTQGPGGPGSPIDTHQWCATFADIVPLKTSRGGLALWFRVVCGFLYRHRGDGGCHKG